MPAPTLSAVTGTTMKELVDAIERQRKDMEFLLSNLDDENIKKISGDIIVEGSLSWGQIGDRPFIPQTAEDLGALRENDPQLTYIDAYGVYTGTISANNIYGGTISGDLINGGTIRGADWMSASMSTPFRVYIGEASYLAMQVFSDAMNLLNNGSVYFRVDTNGGTLNGEKLATQAWVEANGGAAKFG
jgi:hypothetical protein